MTTTTDIALKPPQPRTTFWIDVRDHMPDDEIQVLVYLATDQHQLAYHVDGQWRSAETERELDSEVTHWADPPDPPSWQ